MQLDKLAIVVPTTLQRPIDVLAQVAARLDLASKMGAEICIFINSLESEDLPKLSFFERIDSVVIKVASSKLPIDQSMMQAAFMATRKYILQCGDDDIPSLDLLASSQNYMEKNNLDLVVSCVSEVGVEGSSLNHLYGRWSFSGVTSRRLFIDFFDKLFHGSFIARSELLHNADGWRKFFGTSHAYNGVIWASLIDEKFSLVKIGTTSDCLCEIIKTPKSWQSYAAKIYLIHIPRWYITMATLIPSAVLFSARKSLLSVIYYVKHSGYRFIRSLVLATRLRF